MGVLDFLSDLSRASKKDDLGLGGMRSLLGTRNAAPKGKRGDEMIARTGSDSLPGYFDPNTREYVPWYVDLFDGGGLNKSEGLLASGAQKMPSATGMLGTGGAPVQRASQMANNQLSDMERMQRLDPLRPFGGAGPAIQGTPDTSYYTPPSSMQMPTQARPGMPSYTPPASMQMPAQAPAPFSPAPESTPRLSEMQKPMMQHPAFPKFVDILKRSANERVLQDPRLMQETFNNYLRLEGL